MINAEERGDVGFIEIDRHVRRNALDVDHCQTLGDAVRNLATKNVRAMVITGKGSVFCAGADLGGVYGDQFRHVLYTTLHTITALSIPVIAAVNGPAIGAGTQLALACDLRVGSPRARFAVPTARNGLAVDPWTIRRLATLAGGGAARAMLLGCDEISLTTALARGLVDRSGDVEDALAWAAEIATLSPRSLAYSKLALDSPVGDRDQDRGLDTAFEACWHGDDIAEARQARAEGRPPRFSTGGGG